jgi:hypothetical protein
LQERKKEREAKEKGKYKIELIGLKEASLKANKVKIRRPIIAISDS